MISNFSFVANTQSLTKDSVGRNEDAYLLMIVDQLQRTVDDHKHRFDILEKQIDDLLWFERLGDVANIDKVRLSSTPRWKPKDKEDRFANNKLQFYTYVFIHKDINRKKK